jgi:hypothetical protein
MAVLLKKQKISAKCFFEEAKEKVTSPGNDEVLVY